MLSDLFYSLKDIFFGFNVFRYITFRAALAAITAFLVSLCLGPWITRRLAALKIGQFVRDAQQTGRLYDLHGGKAGTPTMGGVLILFAIVLSTLLWANVTNRYILMVLAATVWLGFIGFCDDYLKLLRQRSQGLTAGVKVVGQVIIGLVFGAMLYFHPENTTNLDIPFFKKLWVDLGPWYIAWTVLVICASSNAVNLTDGLDGLAIGCTIMIAITYSFLSYVTGYVKFSDYLNIVYVPGAGELSVFCASLVGAGMGFLWYNGYPATIFMGDCGSLALGGAIGAVSVLIKKELLLLIVGGIFVAEALSVILQVGSYKLRGERIFLMAPLHHHFQLKGWAEAKVTIRFWIVAGILALLSLLTLKLR